MINKSFPFFPSDVKSLFASHVTSKVFNFEFILRLFILSASFGFHGPPLLAFKIDGLDLRGLDLEKMISFTH